MATVGVKGLNHITTNAVFETDRHIDRRTVTTATIGSHITQCIRCRRLLVCSLSVSLLRYCNSKTWYTNSSLQAQLNWPLGGQEVKGQSYKMNILHTEDVLKQRAKTAKTKGLNCIIFTSHNHNDGYIIPSQRSG